MHFRHPNAPEPHPDAGVIFPSDIMFAAI
jgi:hypothetical protein